MSEAQTRKVAPHHLEREACLYVRQSSPRQVMQNTESTLRQYGLSQRAMALGWPAERIRVIDDDQGKSGAYSENRDGFRDLMGRVAAGDVGIVLGLEVSRLARDNADWHQLLRIAGITNTLILDETGIFDPNDVNDKLLLGVKGTLSEFELQGIMARLIGGQRNAAARGALKMILPIGLAYNDRDEVVFNPDRSIVDAIRLVFDGFRRRGSAMGVVKWMHQENMTLPSRPLSGPTRGELRWALPSFAQVGRILKNPRYAGAFVYGRHRSRRQGDGTTTYRTVPMDEWEVCIPGAHAGFIDWDEFLRNQATLASNAASFLRSGSRTAAPREGAALLQSRILCGHCGRRMFVNYSRATRANGDARAPYHYVCKEDLVRYGRKTCQSMRGDLVDAEMSRFVIEVMNRKNIGLALAVQEQVRAEFASADTQRARRIEAMRYEADMARRRFFEVDPANRLVAAALEAEWNDRLRVLEEACQERETRAAARDIELSERQVERIRELTRDFEQVWHAPETGNADRKRLLGFLIEDATLTRDGYEVTIGLRMRGGKCLTLETQLPRPIALIRKTPPETIAELDRLLGMHTDERTAEELNRMGYRNWKGECYTAKRVRSTRQTYGLPSYRERERKRLRDQGFADAGEMADRLGLNEGTVRKMGRTADDPRVERAVIRTEGRTYCMYRANGHDELACRVPGGNSMIAESTGEIPKAQQGAS